MAGEPPLRPPARWPGVRLAAFYAVLYLGFGAYVPYWPLWLERRGLDPAGIGVVLGLGFLVRVLGIPVIGALVDGAGSYRRPLVLLTVLGVASFVACGLARSPAELLAASLLVASTMVPVPPLTEGLAVSLAREGRIDYGGIRLWGSLAFIVANLGLGALITRRGPEPVLAWIVVALVATSLVGLALPRLTHQPGGSRRWLAAIPELLRMRGMVPFLVGVGLLQASHALYYSTSAIDWRRQGHDATMVGALWAIGVAAEVVFFARSRVLARRFPPATLAIAGGLGGAVRWAILATAPSLPLLVVVQAMHALSFTAVHVGTMEEIRVAVPGRLTATAQGVYSALSGGILLGLATLAGGWLYQRAGAWAYLAMTVLCLLGCAALVAGQRRLAAAV